MDVLNGMTPNQFPLPVYQDGHKPIYPVDAPLNLFSEFLLIAAPKGSDGLAVDRLVTQHRRRRLLQVILMEAD